MSVTSSVVTGATRQMAGVRTYGFREWVDREIDTYTHDERSDNPLIAAGQAGGDVVNTMLVIVVAVIIGYVGIQVAVTTEDSITSTDLSNTDANNQTQFENATESLTSGFSSAMDLTEVVFIVLMLSVVLLALVGLRGRR